MKLLPRAHGYTLVEMMVTVLLTSLILAALVSASSSLYKSYNAIDGYTRAEGDQMRISDYIARDVRRSLSVTASGSTSITTTISGSTSTTTVTVPSLLTMTIPDYYDSSNNPRDPSLNTTTNAISYGTTNPTIRYFQIGTNFYREASGTATYISQNVSAFSVAETDLTSNISCTITFLPTFNFFSSANAYTGTSVFSTTFLRNAAARN